MKNKINHRFISKIYLAYAATIAFQTQPAITPSISTSAPADLDKTVHSVSVHVFFVKTKPSVSEKAESAVAIFSVEVRHMRSIFPTNAGTIRKFTGMDIASFKLTHSEGSIMLSKKIYSVSKSVAFAITAVFLTTLCAHNANAGGAITDNGFVRDAFLSNQTEIEISQWVLANSKKAGTKKLAKGIIKDYSQANTRLRTLAVSKRLEIPAALDESHKAQVEQFKNAGAQQLDAAYKVQIQQHHDAAVALYDRVAKNPRSDAELRVFAFKMLPVLQKHQQAVAALKVAPVTVASRKAS